MVIEKGVRESLKSTFGRAKAWFRHAALIRPSVASGLLTPYMIHARLIIRTKSGGGDHSVVRVVPFADNMIDPIIGQDESVKLSNEACMSHEEDEAVRVTSSRAQTVFIHR